MPLPTMPLPTKILAAALGLALLAPIPFAAAQSTGYVTGFPGKDPAGDEEIGWGPAYRPETSFSQPGTPPTPGDFAGAAYRARTGRGPYDAVQDTRQDFRQGARGVRPVGLSGYAEPARAVRRHHGTARGRHAARRPVRHVSR